MSFNDKFFTGVSKPPEQIEMVFCYQNCSDLLWEKIGSSDPVTLLKFEAEGREFANILRSLENYNSNWKKIIRI